MQVITTLENKPVVVGSTVYNCRGVPFTVSKSPHRDFLLRLTEPGKDSRSAWLTNTHYNGVQVVYWDQEMTEARKHVIDLDNAALHEAEVNDARAELLFRIASVTQALDRYERLTADEVGKGKAINVNVK